jgi:hypothetical protein
MELIATQESVRVRHEGRRVVVLQQGRALLDLPWQAALDLAKALQAQGKRAEEIDRAQAIIADQAIITRLGFRFGLTSHPALLREATQEAAWNRNLRRYIPPSRAMGIASQQIVGAPALIQHRPKPEEESCTTR